MDCQVDMTINIIRTNRVVTSSTCGDTKKGAFIMLPFVTTVCQLHTQSIVPVSPVL